ncbi:MAG: signal peptidase II [Vampirovibrionales bacterium]|nr:signal peptidase II [Vampirovibrionales bacterium]
MIASSAPPLTETPASQRLLVSRRRMAMTTVALLGFSLDWLVKRWVVAHLALSESAPLWPGVAQLTYVRNEGMAFSLFDQSPHALMLVGAAFFVLFLMLGFSQCAAGRGLSIAYGLILGGALGNLVDRFISGSVADYVELTFIRYPVFNLADTLICVGVATALFFCLRTPQAPCRPAS